MLLNEIQNQRSFRHWTQIVEFIQLNCSEYLAQTDLPLFRGMTVKDDVVIYQQRKDRRPLSHSTEEQDAINSHHEIMLNCPNGYIALSEKNLKTFGFNKEYDEMEVTSIETAWQDII